MGERPRAAAGRAPPPWSSWSDVRFRAVLLANIHIGLQMLRRAALAALLATAGAPDADVVTCCVPFPDDTNQTKAGCEALGDARRDGGVYHFNTGRGTPKAVCGQHANCQCCRTGPKSAVCDAPSKRPASAADTNTIVFPKGDIPSLAYVPPGAPGAHPHNGTLLAFMEPLHVARSTDHGRTWSAPAVPDDPASPGDPRWPGTGSHYCCPMSVYDPASKAVFLQFGNSTSMKGGCDIDIEQLGGIRQLQSTDAGSASPLPPTM